MGLATAGFKTVTDLTDAVTLFMPGEGLCLLWINSRVPLWSPPSQDLISPRMGAAFVKGNWRGRQECEESLSVTHRCLLLTSFLDYIQQSRVCFPDVAVFPKIPSGILGLCPASHLSCSVHHGGHWFHVPTGRWSTSRLRCASVWNTWWFQTHREEKCIHYLINLGLKRWLSR